MRIFLIAATAAALVGGASLAYAANTVGSIKSINTIKDSVTLANGSTYWAPKTMKLSNFKVGEKVAIAYTQAKSRMGQERMDVQTLTPAA